MTLAEIQRRLGVDVATAMRVQSVLPPAALPASASPHAKGELESALLKVARTLERMVFEKLSPSDEELRSSMSLVHDMQREARDGTLKLSARPASLEEPQQP